MAGNDSKTPHPVDVAVGSALRNRRRHLGLSQPELADVLGISFQQVQKYERGDVRVSASRLFEIAQALKMPAGAFFPGIGAEDDAQQLNEAQSSADRLLASPDGQELADLFPNIADPVIRRHVVDLVRSLQAKPVSPPHSPQTPQTPQAA